MPPAGSPALLLYAHGSPEPGWRAPFDALADALRAAAPGRPLRLAFLERMRPTLDEALADLATEGVTAVRIVPLFLAAGRHTRVDLPARVAELRDRLPGITLTVDATLLESAPIRAAIARALLDAES